MGHFSGPGDTWASSAEAKRLLGNRREDPVDQLELRVRLTELNRSTSRRSATHRLDFSSMPPGAHIGHGEVLTLRPVTKPKVRTLRVLGNKPPKRRVVKC